jgi:hypothetical protein
MNETEVEDYKGNMINFEAAMNLADQDIMDDIDLENPQEFVEEYARRHEEKYGEEYAPYAGGAW